MSRWTNRDGWWGILRRCLWISIPTVLVGIVVAWAVSGGGAASSLALGGAAVVLLSALTLALTAWVWDKSRDHAVVVMLGAFVGKMIVFALLLTLVPRPDWLETTPAGIGALLGIVVWQVAEVLAFMGTRQQIYDDAPAA